MLLKYFSSLHIVVYCILFSYLPLLVLKVRDLNASSFLPWGIWAQEDVGLCQALEDAALSRSNCGTGLGKWDEDADVDEAEEERDPLADKEHFVLER